MEEKKKLDGAIVDAEIYMIKRVMDSLNLLMEVCNDTIGVEHESACVEMTSDVMKRQIGQLNIILENFKDNFDGLEQYEPIKVD